MKYDNDVSYIQVNNDYILLQKQMVNKKEITNNKINEITNLINTNKTLMDDITLKIINETNQINLSEKSINTLETEPNYLEYRLLTSQLNMSFDSSQEDIQKRLDETTKDLTSINITKTNADNKVKFFNEELKDVEYERILTVLNNLVNNERAILVSINDFETEINAFKLTKETTNEELILLLNTIDDEVKNKLELLSKVTLLNKIVVEMLPKIDIEIIKNEIIEVKKNIMQESELIAFVNDAKDKYSQYIENTISKHFNTKSINDIYHRIDPHPTHKEVIFIPEFDDGRTKLRVKTRDESGENHDDPLLYNSSGQISILSLSIFLAKALQTKDDLDTIFLDDPIQYLDAINVLSFIDLLRTIITQEKRQIVISTHDKNFYQLLQRKLDSDYYNSKFIELESYGKIKEAS